MRAANDGSQPLILVVGNKIDLEEEREVSKKEGIDLAKSLHAVGYVESCAVSAAKVDEPFHTIVRAVFDSLAKQDAEFATVLKENRNLARRAGRKGGSSTKWWHRLVPCLKAPPPPPSLTMQRRASFHLRRNSVASNSGAPSTPSSRGSTSLQRDALLKATAEASAA